MKVQNELIQFAKIHLKNSKLKDTVIGTKMIFSEFDTGRFGISSNIFSKNKLTDWIPGDLTSIGPDKALEMLNSKNFISASFGLSCVNSVSNVNNESNTNWNNILNEGFKQNNRIGMIGYFRPLIYQLKEKWEVYAFDKRAFLRDEPYFYPEDDITERIPNCSIVIISATTLINSSFSQIYELLNKDSLTILMGPSCPMLPEIFSKYKKIKVLAGRNFVNPKGIKQIIQEGGGTPHLKKFSEKIYIDLR